MNAISIKKIKHRTRHTSPYFFSPETMRFFNQTLEDFEIQKSPKGKLFLYAPFYDDANKKIGYVLREVKTPLIRQWAILTPSDCPIPRTWEDVQEYIQSH